MWKGSPNTLFAFGVFVLLLGLVYLISGKVWVRFQGWVYSNEEPRRYWLELALYFVCGLGLMLYAIFSIPN
jgi:hypothetical protein